MTIIWTLSAKWEANGWKLHSTYYEFLSFGNLTRIKFNLSALPDIYGEKRSTL